MKLAALMKKEFHRFFHDPRLIVTMLIPGLLIFILYSVLGEFIWSKDSQKYDYNVYVCGESAAVTTLLESAAGEALTLTETTDSEAAKREVEEGKATALLVFSEQFDESVAAYTPASGSSAPQVEIYYRSADEASLAFYTLATAVLNGYESAIANKFDVNAAADAVYDFSDGGNTGMAIMSGILPFIVVIFIFSACMSITLESVAGEKERGTLATILVTSVKRTHIALGKVIPLSCIAAIGAASSFIGVSLSMPKLMGLSIGSIMGGYGFVSYLLLFLLIVSVVPLIVSLLTVISAYAKSVKEASAYTSVVMIVVMVLSLVSVFISGIGEWIVAVPVLNAVACMQGILTMQLSVWQSLVSVLANLVYTGLLVFAVSKMLSSEKLMFGI